MNFQDLFKNNLYNSESYEYPESPMNGGAKTINEPDGGFPPIYECKEKEKDEVKDNTKREYKTHKETISIRELMESRRKNKVFIK